MRGLTVLIAMLALPAYGEEIDGKLAYNSHCRTCHTVREGDNRLGPNLFEIIGRKAGKTNGYRFSSAFTNVDLVWDWQTLDAFIAAPSAIVPGNDMKPYGGIADPEVRAKIVEYLAHRGHAESKN